MTENGKIENKATETEVKPRSGTDLRDRSWGLIYSAGLDYSPKYLGSELDGEKQPVDGLIRTPRGYYRLAEDTRDGTRVLLHSWERDQLTGIEKDGNIVLDPSLLEGKKLDVYGVTARNELRGNVFRDDMNIDMRVLEKAFQKDLNLHAEEILIPSEDPSKPPKRKVKLANGLVAFGIMETDDGKWKIRLYNNLRKDWDDSARFVQVGTEPENGYKGSILNPGRTLKDSENNTQEFESLEDAVKYVQKFWHTESRQIFKGKTNFTEDKTLNGYEKIRNNVLSTLMKWNDKKLIRDWTRAIGVGVTVGLVSTALSGTPILGALMGVGVGLGWTTLGKITETAVGSVQRAILDKDEDQRLEALRPYFEQNHINKYLLDDEFNPKRFRKKLDPEAASHLRLLSTDEARMKYDDAEPSSPNLQWRDYERLSSAAFRYFGAAFDSSYDDADSGILVAMYPNGLLSLSHIDKKSGNTRSYVMYNDEYVPMKGDKKHLDPALTNLPGNGDIHKITHRQGKDFRYVPLTCEEFLADVSHQTGKDLKDLKAFGIPLKDLFNCKSCDIEKIEPKNVDALPVQKWFTDAASPIEQAEEKITEEQDIEPQQQEELTIPAQSAAPKVQPG